MPTYAYLCKKCESPFELTKSFSEPDPTACPSCGGELRKQFGNLGVTFKGSGFYRTDSASSSSSSRSD